MVKIVVVGVGNVGANAARLLFAYDELVLIDANELVLEGKAMDLLHAAAICTSSVRITIGYANASDADIIIFAAGFARKGDMRREDLAMHNATVVRQILFELKTRAPNAMLIMVTNPVDVMCHVALEFYDAKKIIGVSGVLDSGRFASAIAHELKVNVGDVDACVIGSHTNEMLPLARYTLVRGTPLTQCLDEVRITTLIEKTRHAGKNVSSLLGVSAHYGPAAAIARMVDAIVHGCAAPLCCSMFLQGEYGFHEVFLGVPVRFLGAYAYQIIELDLHEIERSQLECCAEHVQAITHNLDISRRNTPKPKP